MKNGVTLTPEGEILYEHISKAVELITEGEDEISKPTTCKAELSP